MEMPKTKVAILGGGMAGLATAFELTATPELRDRFEVTIHTLGWRLGGKLASGRSDPGDRNLEHGLHVWFGFYENAFALIRRCYAEWTPPPDAPIRSWRDAFNKRSYTPIPGQTDGRWTYFPLLWPENDELPGDGTTELSAWGAITEIIGVLEVLLCLPYHGADAPSPPHVEVPGHLAALWLSVRTRVGEATAVIEAAGSRLEMPEALRLLRQWAKAVEAYGLEPGHLGALTWLVREACAIAQRALRVYLGVDRRFHFLAEASDVLLAVVRGLLDPRWGILEHADASRIDQFEFRDWLIENGADPVLVRNGAFVRSLYDAAFEYVDGDLARPSLEAGTGLRGLLRMVGTYKGAVFWEVVAGMGDVVIAPLYQVLRARGVRVEFFRRLERIELDAGRTGAARLHFAQQAALAGPTYDPLIHRGGLDCWPMEPRWEQLVDGDRLRAAGVNFESHWCSEPPVGAVVLDRGTDFDVAVLAIPLGAYKPLNDDPGPCDEVIAASPRFATMVRELGVVPTLAMQLWVLPDLQGLGFAFKRPNTTASPAMVPMPEPFDTYADMSQVLTFEGWQGPTRPRSLHYFCGPYGTMLYRAPSRDAGVPARARDEVKARALAWLDTYPGFVWPRAARPGSLGLDWSVLHDPEGREGPARFDAQYWRANIDPTECCVGSFRDTSRHRLRADETGVTNLVLAGECARTGLNVTCVEAVVMSAMAAARAISGSPRTIVGEHFLAR